jgi:hypothetical protein
VRDGIFTRFSTPPPAAENPHASIAQFQEAGPARDIPLGKISEPVASEPSDADFAKAAVWLVKVPSDIDLATDPILRIHYVGDVARVILNGRLLVDDFYNGNAFDLGLRRYAPEIIGGDLRIAILPLRKDALAGENKRIFMADSARPDFGSASSMAQVKGVEIVPRYEVELSPAAAP